MPPLADKHGVAVVEVGDDERGVGKRNDDVVSLDAVWEPDQILAKRETLGPAHHFRGNHLEWSARGMAEGGGYRCTIAATAAAAAAKWRGSGP